MTQPKIDTGRDLMDLLNELQERITKLGAIEQAAADYVVLMEVVKPFSITDEENVKQQISAYRHLKELVYE